MRAVTPDDYRGEFLPNLNGWARYCSMDIRYKDGETQVVIVHRGDFGWVWKTRHGEGSEKSLYKSARAALHSLKLPVRSHSVERIKL